MSVTIYRQVTFGPAYGGLGGAVGYALYNANGALNAARTANGVSERGVGTGIYGADVTFPSTFDGEIRWDTGGGSPVYASESVTADDLGLAAATASSGSVGAGTLAVGTSLQTLVERVAQAEDSLQEFAATGLGTASTAISTSVWQDDNYWNGAYLYVKATAGGGAPQGEGAPVKQFTQGNNTLTLPVALTAAIPNGAVVQLYDKWSRPAIVNAINDAIREAGGYWFQAVVDETLLTVSATYSYSLSGLTVPVEERYGLSRVSIQRVTSPTLLTYPYDEAQDVEVRWNGSTPTLQFTALWPPNRIIRLEYIASPAALATPADLTGVISSTWIDNFIVEWALFYLYRQRAGRAIHADKKIDIQLAQLHRDEAERIRHAHQMRLPAGGFKPALVRQRRDDGTYLAGFSVPQR